MFRLSLVSIAAWLLIAGPVESQQSAYLRELRQYLDLSHHETTLLRQSNEVYVHFLIDRQPWSNT